MNDYISWLVPLTVGVLTAWKIIVDISRSKALPKHAVRLRKARDARGVGGIYLILKHKRILGLLFLLVLELEVFFIVNRDPQYRLTKVIGFRNLSEESSSAADQKLQTYIGVLNSPDAIAVAAGITNAQFIPRNPESKTKLNEMRKNLSASQYRASALINIELWYNNSLFAKASITRLQMWFESNQSQLSKLPPIVGGTANNIPLIVDFGTLIDEIPYVHIIEKIRLQRRMLIITAFLGALLVSLLVAALIDLIDGTLQHPEEIEKFLKVPFIGFVPHIKVNSIIERDLAVHVAPHGNAAEHFRSVRAKLNLFEASKSARLVAITSTIPAEGKSLFASNYAIALAKAGYKTLLVDGDLRRPTIHKAFELQSPIGLSFFLEGKVKFDDIVHTTEIELLDVVCCGAVPENPAELLVSKSLVLFLEVAQIAYERIVVDCPPVGAVADPLIIGANCEGVVYVVKYGSVFSLQALRAVQALKKASIPIIGAVLNDLHTDEGFGALVHSLYYYQNRYYADYKAGKSHDM